MSRVPKPVTMDCAARVTPVTWPVAGASPSSCTDPVTPPSGGEPGGGTGGGTGPGSADAAEPGCGGGGSGNGDGVRAATSSGSGSGACGRGGKTAADATTAPARLVDVASPISPVSGSATAATTVSA